MIRQNPNQFAVSMIVGKVTFFEIVRDKVLYNIVIVSLLLLGLGYLASKLTLGRPERVILDFGLSALALSSITIGMLVGAAAIGREFERRTIYVALSHPISRFNFVLGKFTGIVFVLISNWILLSAAYLTILWITASDPQDVFHSTLAWGLVFVLFQGIFSAAIAVFFSSFSTTSLSVVLTMGLYLIGANISQIRMIAVRTQDAVGAATLNAVAYLLPNFEYFGLGTKVTYGLEITWQYGVMTLLYGIVYCAICLTAAGLLVRSKES